MDFESKSLQTIALSQEIKAVSLGLGSPRTCRRTWEYMEAYTGHLSSLEHSHTLNMYSFRSYPEAVQKLSRSYSGAFRSYPEAIQKLTRSYSKAVQKLSRIYIWNGTLRDSLGPAIWYIWDHLWFASDIARCFCRSFCICCLRAGGTRRA